MVWETVGGGAMTFGRFEDPACCPERVLFPKEEELKSVKCELLPDGLGELQMSQSWALGV